MTPDSNAAGLGRPTPNTLPRPPEEAEALARAWAMPSGWRMLSEVNNTFIGPLMLGTALILFLGAGVLALLIRLQLLVPGGTFLDAATYNQVFTMHGTVMLFLFAVPAVEAVGIILLPAMLGAREMPFPRLGAFALWAYAVGGFAFFCSIFFGIAPDGGWFMYPPLTSKENSPGINTDMYLLGIGFIEISAIAGAIELTVGILRNRAPGMTLGRMPIFAWAMLVFALMVLVAFPAVITASILLELERMFDWPFFLPERGGDPMLWQHLFWFFGHPEVYIIFLPAAGMVSMIAPTMSRAPLLGHGMVVVALLGTAFLSFGLWVHHMYATGIPAMSLGFFAAAGFAVAVPSALQIFSWIGTLASGRPRWNDVPTLFLLGFLFVFTFGGLTGIMVAVTPFDWQAHDTYFIVAHLHYVLVGGMVFPLLAAIYYWAPRFSAPLSDRLGRWAFWLIFAGTHVAFAPMHVSGLIGMPRRIYTYPAGMGLEWLNVVSTVGAFLFAAGAAVVLIDVALHYRPSRVKAGNPWGAGTLEWIGAGDNWGVRSIPRVEGRYPLWDRPALAREVEAGGHYLPGTATGRREALVTSTLEAEPVYVAVVPGPGWAHLVAALAIAAHFLLLAFSQYVLSLAAGLLFVAALIRWLWQGTDHGPLAGAVHVGDGVRVPSYRSGPDNTSWWGMGAMALADASVFACLCGTYLFLWLVNAPGAWLPAGAALPSVAWALSVLPYAAAAAALCWARPRPGITSPWPHRLALVAAAALLLSGFGLDLLAQRAAGLDPTAGAYGASVGALLGWQGFHLGTALIMLGYALARSLCGMVDGVRRVSYDNVALFCGYTAAQGAATALLLHGFPRLL